VGGRSERVVRDVLRATAMELARVGYAALRVEDVAAGAGVNKTTVYRRWPTKAALVAAALRAHGEHEREPPDTGALRSDCLELLRRHVALCTSPEGRAIMRVILVEMDDPDVAAVARALREEKLAPWLAAIRRAVKRGEIPKGSQPALMVDLMLGTVIGKLRRGEAVDDDYREAVVDLVLTGVKHGGAVRR
jgi:AcrR family transcriptional regulator